MIKIPTQAQLDAAAGVFADDWALVDDVLYGVCRRYPTHIVRGHTLGDVVRAVPDAVLGVVPGGGAVTPFLALVCSTPAQRRRDEYLEDVSERVRMLENAGLLRRDDFQGEDFTTAVLRTVPMAMSTAAAEKRAALRNAVVNTALGRQPSEDVFEMFLRYVEDLTPLHIRLLVLFDNPEKRCRDSGVDLSGVLMGAPWQVVFGVYPELQQEEAICSHAWSELNARGLVNVDSLGGMMSSSGIVARRTTDLGRRFVAFISEPTEDTGV